MSRHSELNLQSTQELKNVRSLPQLADRKTLNKMLPKKISIDKERLYEENLSLRQLYNILLEENLKLRTKFDRAYKKLDEGRTQEGLAKNLNLIEKLKNNIRELKSEVQIKDKEIIGLKIQRKANKVSQIEEELEFRNEECERLKRAIKEMSHLKTDDELNELKVENFRLHNELKVFLKNDAHYSIPKKKDYNETGKNQQVLVRLLQVEKELESKNLQISALMSEIERIKNGNKSEEVQVSNKCRVLVKIEKFLRENLISPENWIRSITTKADISRSQLAQALDQDLIECTQDEISEFFQTHSNDPQKIMTKSLVSIFSEHSYHSLNLHELFEQFKARSTIHQIQSMKKYLASIWDSDKIDEKSFAKLFSSEIFKVNSKTEEKILNDYFFENCKTVTKSKIILKILLQFDDWKPIDYQIITEYIKTTQANITHSYETLLSAFQQNTSFQNTITFLQFINEMSSANNLKDDTERTCLRAIVYYHEKSIKSIDYLKVLRILQESSLSKDFIQCFKPI